VFHLLLALYILAFAITIGPLIMALLLNQKTGDYSWLAVAGIMTGGILLLVSDGVKTYAGAALGSVPYVMTISALACTLVGSAMMQWSIPTIAFRVLRKPLTPPLALARLLATIIVGAAGAAKELYPSGALQGVHGLLTAGSLGGYGLYVMLNLSLIEHDGARTFARDLFILICVLIPLIAAQGALESVLRLPFEFSQAPFVQLVYQIASCSLCIYCAVRYLFGPSPREAGDIPADFVRRFSISEREQEIIALVVKGLSNKQIGDQLFISSQTVKNHIYNIYRKTGVANKVQLLNQIQRGP
jgi:DNA-binding CsgD family transcriptional regulator